MVHTSPASEEAPHLGALRNAADAGFRFVHLRDDHGIVTAIYAERRCVYGVVEYAIVRGMTEAVSARIRFEDHPNGDPLWEHAGGVAEVIAALLALPPHGSRGAPTVSRRASSALWLPGGSR